MLLNLREWLFLLCFKRLLSDALYNEKTTLESFSYLMSRKQFKIVSNNLNLYSIAACIALSIPPYNIIWLNIKFDSINNLNGNYMRILVNFSCKSMRDRTDVIVHRFISVCVYLKLFQLFSNLCSSYWFPFNVHVFHAGVFSPSISLPYSIFSLLLICHVVFIRMANLAHTSLFN